MAFQFFTVSKVLEDILHRGNLKGREDQHPPDRLIALWNDSNQTLREIVSQHSPTAFMKKTTPANLPTTPAIAGEVYAEIPWPTDAISIYSVRAQQPGVSSNRWRPLKEASVDALHDFQRPRVAGADANRAIAYVTGEVPFGAVEVENPGTIQLVPVPRGGLYQVWYIQAWQPVTDLDAKVNYIAAFHDYTVWDTVIKSTGKTGKAGHTYNLAVRERDRVEARIVSRAMRLSEAGGLEPRNARMDGFDHFYDDEWE